MAGEKDILGGIPWKSSLMENDSTLLTRVGETPNISIVAWVPSSNDIVIACRDLLDYQRCGSVEDVIVPGDNFAPEVVL